MLSFFYCRCGFGLPIRLRLLALWCFQHEIQINQWLPCECFAGILPESILKRESTTWIRNWFHLPYVCQSIQNIYYWGYESLHCNKTMSTWAMSPHFPSSLSIDGHESESDVGLALDGIWWIRTEQKLCFRMCLTSSSSSRNINKYGGIWRRSINILWGCLTCYCGAIYRRPLVLVYNMNHIPLYLFL